MINNKTKAIILRIIFIAGFLAMCISIVNKFPSKEKFAKWSVIMFVFAYIIGNVCGFVHYEKPLLPVLVDLYVFELGLGIILSVLFGIVIYLLSKVYFSLIKE